MKSLYRWLGYEEELGPGEVSSSHQRKKSIDTRAIVSEIFFK